MYMLLVVLWICNGNRTEWNPIRSVNIRLTANWTSTQEKLKFPRKEEEPSQEKKKKFVLKD